MILIALSSDDTSEQSVDLFDVQIGSVLRVPNAHMHLAIATASFCRYVDLFVHVVAFRLKVVLSA